MSRTSSVRCMIQAALAAMEVQQGYAAQSLRVQYKGAAAADIVTEVDHACEAAIADILRREFPECGLIGEEGARQPAIADAQGNKYFFYFDPLDGTANFTAPWLGQDTSVAIARVRVEKEEMRIEAGAVLLPRSGRLYWADNHAGAGFYRNSIPPFVEAGDTFLSPASHARKGEVWVLQGGLGHGLPAWLHEDDYARTLGLLAACDALGYRLRGSGSTVADMVRVADALSEGIPAATFSAAGFGWDYAAGAALIRAAGGVVRVWMGSEVHGLEGDDRLLLQSGTPADAPLFYPVLAGAPEVVDELIRLLQEY